MSKPTNPGRTLSKSDLIRYVLVHVVWEITLACNLKCQHCGSRAGKPRPNELTTTECLRLVDEFASLGVREVNLIGGEAFLRKDWTEIVRAIRSYDIECYIQTGGLHFTDSLLEEGIAAGLNGIGVSIDGLPDLHDQLRGVPGSFRQAIDLLTRAKAAGLHTGVNTQIGALILPQLSRLMENFIAINISLWRLHLTVAMGNAVDNDHLLLQPYQLLEFMPQMAELFCEGQRHGLTILPGNNIGYFGPYEHLWRWPGHSNIHWTGCRAGQNAIGIEADGTIKGCPSLPTVGYAGGNIRDFTLEEIWRTSEAMHFGRLRSVDDLWGFCRTCYYADVCRAGCTWTSHSLLGRPGNNPYCHHRAIELEKAGLREYIVKKKSADDTPFAIGEFEIFVETIPEFEGKAIQVTPPEPRKFGSDCPSAIQGQLPPQLVPCRFCQCHIWVDEIACPHCGKGVQNASISSISKQSMMSWSRG